MSVKLILYKRGNFYRCYDEDSYILAYLLDYRVTMTDNNDMSGFPIGNLDKVLDEFEKNKISYIVYDSIKEGKIKAECDFGQESKYAEINEKAYEYVKVRNRIEKIYDNLKEKINEKSITDILVKIEGIL